MIVYLVDLFLNNLCIYVFATILFLIGKYNIRDLCFLLFIDIFINEIPIIFICVFGLNYLNKWIRKYFVNGFLLDNLLFVLNFLIFFFVIFFYKNNFFYFSGLFNFYITNFLINYILFLIINRLNNLKT